VQDSFGDGDEVDQISQDPEDVRLMAEDEKYFAVADLNRDGRLSAEEFAGFQNPEHYEHMHDMLMKTTLAEKDTNKDGKIDLKEFLGDVAENPTSDWYHSEKERFMNEYDTNKDGFLEGEELRAWLIPNTRQTAEDEANHLITQSDSNGDGRLSIEEIVDEHQLFVGSEVTNYGDMLQHTEL